MGALEIILGIVLIILAIAVVAVVLFQEGHQQNSATITGEHSDTFLRNHKSRSIDAFLERWTRIIAVGFFILVIVVNMLMYFHVIGK